MTHYTQFPRPVSYAPLERAHIAVTMRLADPSDDLLVRHVRLLRDCVALAQQRWGFEIDAAVVLPNEFQLLCVFEDAEFGVLGAIQLVCAAFSHHAPRGIDVVWAEDFEMTKILQSGAVQQRLYIEDAPVRAGLVKRAQDWPFSSAHRTASQGSDLGIAVA